MNRRSFFQWVGGAVTAAFGCQLPMIQKIVKKNEPTEWTNSEWIPINTYGRKLVLLYIAMPNGELKQIYPPDGEE